MNKTQLDHILRASAGITGGTRFIVIGSQAILAHSPEAPAELLASMEVDLFSPDHPEYADLIDGSIGEGSPFHRTFGYFAHGVGEETATLPTGWRNRLIAVEGPTTGGAVGLCLEVHDLAVSKLVAGREKDLAFLEALIRHGLARPDVIAERLMHARIPDRIRLLCAGRLGKAIRGATGQAE